LPHGIIVLPNGIKVQRSGDQDPVVFGRRAFTGAVGPCLQFVPEDQLVYVLRSAVQDNRCGTWRENTPAMSFHSTPKMLELGWTSKNMQHKIRS
jgi:hypothetical protein